MPRARSTGAPDFQEVIRDVRRLGPLTEAYGEYLVRTRGYQLPSMAYSARRRRGTEILRELLYFGDVSENNVIQAVYEFHLNRVTTGERASITPNYEFRPR